MRTFTFILYVNVKVKDVFKSKCVILKACTFTSAKNLHYFYQALKKVWCILKKLKIQCCPCDQYEICIVKFMLVCIFFVIRMMQELNGLRKTPTNVNWKTDSGQPNLEFKSKKKYFNVFIVCWRSLYLKY